MENSTAQWVMAFGTALAAFGTLCAAAVAAVAAYLSFRSLRRQELRDIPRAAVETVRKHGGIAAAYEIVVSNIGAVPFSIVAVGVGDTSLHASAFAVSLNLPDNSIVRTVQPGGNTRFGRPAASGRAWVRLADGSVFEERYPDRDEYKDASEQHHGNADHNHDQHH